MKITRAWWVTLDALAAGDVETIEVPTGVEVEKISSYCVGGTSVTFNVEKRTTIGTPGSDLLASDQVAVPSSLTSSSTIQNNPLAAGNILCVSITSVSGAVTKFAVTVVYSYHELEAVADLAAAGSIEAVSLTQQHTLSSIGNLTTAGGIGTVVLQTIPGVAYISKVYDLQILNPAVGGIECIEIPAAQTVTKISAYTSSNLHAAFNIEERSSIGSSGQDILTSDLAVGYDGASSTDFASSGIAAGNFLYVDISSISPNDEEPTWLSISIVYSQTLELEVGLTVAGLATAGTLGEPTLSTSHYISPAAVTTAGSIGAVLLTQDQTLANVADLVTAGTLPNLTMAMVRYVDFALGVSHLLVVADMSTDNSIGEPTLEASTDFLLAVSGLTTAGSVAAVALTQAHVVTPQDVLTRSQVGAIALTQAQTLVVADLASEAVLDALTLSEQNHWLIPTNLATAGTIGAPVLVTSEGSHVVKPHYHHPRPRKRIIDIHRRA